MIIPKQNIYTDLSAKLIKFALVKLIITAVLLAGGLNPIELNAQDDDEVPIMNDEDYVNPNKTKNKNDKDDSYKKSDSKKDKKGDCIKNWSKKCDSKKGKKGDCKKEWNKKCDSKKGKKGDCKKEWSKKCDSKKGKKGDCKKNWSKKCDSKKGKKDWNKKGKYDRRKTGMPPPPMFSPEAREKYDIFHNLSPQEKRMVGDALRKAHEDPDVIEARKDMKESSEGLLKAIKKAVKRDNPEVAKIFEQKQKNKNAKSEKKKKKRKWSKLSADEKEMIKKAKTEAEKSDTVKKAKDELEKARKKLRDSHKKLKEAYQDEIADNNKEAAEIMESLKPNDED